MDLSAGLNPQAVRLAVVFPGQGSQQAAMGRSLRAAWPAAEARLAALSEGVGEDLGALLDSAEPGRDPLRVHLAMVSYGLLAWEWLRDVRGLRPQLLAGHSLGEITALACSGALSAADALRLARERGRCLAEACASQPGGMTAFVGEPLAAMRRAISAWIGAAGLGDRVWIVNHNGPRQLVVAGAAEALAALATAMREAGLTAVPLATAGAFHTPFMAPAALQLAAFLRTLDFQPPRIPVVSSMTGRLLTQPAALATHLALQVVKPVRWLEAMRSLQRAQITQVVEVSSGKGVLCPLIASCEDWPVTAQSLALLLGADAPAARAAEARLSA